MATKPIGPWPLGMDNVSEDGQHQRNRAGRPLTLDDCVNGDVDRTGKWSVRPGLVAALAAADVQHFWSTGPDATVGYGRQQDKLVRLDVTGNTLTATVLADLDGCQPIDFCEMPGGIAYCTPGGNGLIRPDDTVEPLSVPDASTPNLTAGAVGGLRPGRYAVAYAWSDAKGKLGGLSGKRFIDVPAGGGITISLPPAPAGVTAARVYRTPANGDALYWCADVPAAMPTYLIGHSDTGEQTTTSGLRAMPPGRYIRHWNGRLLVARGRHLFVSEPMAYGLYHSRHRIVQFRHPVAFIEPVAGGVFVGLIGDTVLFLGGGDPAEWTMARTGGAAPVPGSSVRIDASLLDPQMELSGELALWLAANGYVLGTPDGQIVQPQARRIRLPVAAAGHTAVFDRRIITLTQ